jgi:hypothetical protein
MAYFLPNFVCFFFFLNRMKSYVTKAKRALIALPGALRSALQSFGKWLVQFSKELAADPRGKLQQV